METIAVSYLDDNYDDYIENSHRIFKQIIKTNTKNDGTVDLIRVFYDLVGIYRGITLSKIIIVFSKISYPHLQELLQQYGSAYLTNSEFAATMLDFYTILIENTSQKYSVAQAHTVMYKILTDACRIVSMFVKDINQTMEKIATREEMVKFLENNLKLVKRFLKIFKSLLKFSDISFTIFHFFGEVIFLEFIKNIHQFIYLISDYIINYFPDKEDEFLSCFMESCSSLSDFIVEFFDPSEVEKIFRVIHSIFAKRAEMILNNSESKNLYDESIIQNINSLVTSLCTSFYEEHNINIENQVFTARIVAIISSNRQIVSEFCFKIIEFCHMVNYNFHLNNLIADVVFNVLTVFGSAQILEFIRDRLVSYWRIDLNTPNYESVTAMFSELQTDILFKLDITNKEKFHTKFKEFIKTLVKFSQ